MASSSPNASASGGDEAKCEVFDIPVMSWSEELRKQKSYPVIVLLLKRAQSTLHFNVSGGSFVHVAVV